MGCETVWPGTSVHFPTTSVNETFCAMTPWMPPPPMPAMPDSSGLGAAADSLGTIIEAAEEEVGEEEVEKEE